MHWLNCHLRSHLLMKVDNRYCKQYGPRSDCFLWSSLILLSWSKYFGVYLNVCSRCNKHTASQSPGRGPTDMDDAPAR